MKGLDADTSSKCFAALLGRNGLLRKRGTTVIMATHNGMQDADFDVSKLADHDTKRNGFRMPIGSSYWAKMERLPIAARLKRSGNRTTTFAAFNIGIVPTKKVTAKRSHPLRPSHIENPKQYST